MALLIETARTFSWKKGPVSMAGEDVLVSVITGSRSQIEAQKGRETTELRAAAGHFGLAATARTHRSRRLTGRRISGFHAAPLTRLRSAASSIEEPRPRLRLDVSEADCDGDSGLTGF